MYDLNNFCFNPPTYAVRNYIAFIYIKHFIVIVKKYKSTDFKSSPMQNLCTDCAIFIPVFAINYFRYAYMVCIYFRKGLVYTGLQFLIYEPFYYSRLYYSRLIWYTFQWQISRKGSCTTDQYRPMQRTYPVSEFHFRGKGCRTLSSYLFSINLRVN
jgi:hypothetical protein